LRRKIKWTKMFLLDFEKISSCCGKHILDRNMKK